jgi:hypothetical protein
MPLLFKPVSWAASKTGISQRLRGHAQPLRALNQYFNQANYEVATGWIDPKGGFSLQSILGHLCQSPQRGATVTDMPFLRN